MKFSNLNVLIILRNRILIINVQKSPFIQFGVHKKEKKKIKNSTLVRRNIQEIKIYGKALAINVNKFLFRNVFGSKFLIREYIMCNVRVNTYKFENGAYIFHHFKMIMVIHLKKI